MGRLTRALARRVGIGAVVAGVCVGALAGAAGAAVPLAQLVVAVPGAIGSPDYQGVSSDGSTVFFVSAAPVLGAPTSGGGDLFASSGGTVTDVAAGQTLGCGNRVYPQLIRSSQDGSRVFYYGYVPVDCSLSIGDLFEESGGVRTRISPQVPTHDIDFAWASPDGSRVIFWTRDALVPEDTNTYVDLYERTPQGLRILPGTGGATFEAATTDGSRIFFFTNHLYELHDGAVRIADCDPGDGHPAPAFLGISADGSHVYLKTAEPLSPLDRDPWADIYDCSAKGAALLATGPGDPTVNTDFHFLGSSANGSHVFFETERALDARDTNSAIDVYDRTDGVTRLVSTGTQQTGDRYEASSADGSCVLFATGARLVPEDTDSEGDLYRRCGQRTQRITNGPADSNTRFRAFIAASPDLSRIVFTSQQQLTPDDTDQSLDLYAWSNGTIVRLSRGPIGGNGKFDLLPLGTSADASRVIFQTQEPLTPGAVPGQFDIYAVDVPDLPPAPQSSLPAHGRGRDNTPPHIKLSLSRRDRHTARGLLITLLSNEAARVSLRIVVSSPTARRLHLHGHTQLVRHTVHLRAGKRTRLRLHLSRSIVRAVRHLHSVHATLLLSATDSSANTRRAKRALALRP
jgi:hypothetical protein